MKNRSNLKALGPLLNKTWDEAYGICHLSGRPAVVVQGPPGTGKIHTLALIAMSYAIKENKKCLIAAPSNNAANEFATKIMEI
jgi:Rad3-related DNA helicase